MIRHLRNLLIISVFIFATASTAMADNIEAKRGVVKNGYNFWLYSPDSIGVEKPKPVVIFLHGASLCGNNMDRVRRYGTLDAIERGRKIDAFVIAPQNPGGAWRPSNVINILDWVLKNNNGADPNRVYLIGMSLGGYGTIDVAAEYPDRIAAAMSFCGGGTSRNLSALNNVPLWIVHGMADRAISINESDKVVNTMRISEPSLPRLIYNRIPGMNHSQPARFFYMQECYDWLFSHNLTDEGRPASPKFDIATKCKSAYTDLRSNGKKRSSITKKSKRKKNAARHSKSKKKSRSASIKK